MDEEKAPPMNVLKLDLSERITQGLQKIDYLPVPIIKDSLIKDLQNKDRMDE